ncbi:YqgE/AlgH family protein [Afifella pfennigii]|uniref:YqgE/AlgH family protein n=1 Tax=Afifella pfennigii TaxID=209897 RepID=UPI00054DDF22|nr:YqgE/AlgH family protein [Afifella pfennigii]
MTTAKPNSGFLDGQFLIAMPTMGDKRFERTVIYLCAHSEQGAMGIVINKLAPDIRFRDLLSQLDIGEPTGPEGEQEVEQIRVHRGGPVETGRGFVLHSCDFFLEDATLPISDEVCLTATLDVLRAIADGKGPSEALLALGYAGWAPGQLEMEIQSNGWLNGPADNAILFDSDLETKYDRALSKIGVAEGRLSSLSGHA